VAPPGPRSLLSNPRVEFALKCSSRRRCCTALWNVLLRSGRRKTTRRGRRRGTLRRTLLLDARKVGMPKGTTLIVGCRRDPGRVSRSDASNADHRAVMTGPRTPGAEAVAPRDGDGSGRRQWVSLRRRRSQNRWRLSKPPSQWWRSTAAQPRSSTAFSGECTTKGPCCSSTGWRRIARIQARQPSPASTGLSPRWNECS
jgi:hypothetical protein